MWFQKEPHDLKINRKQGNSNWIKFDDEKTEQFAIELNTCKHFPGLKVWYTSLSTPYSLSVSFSVFLFLFFIYVYRLMLFRGRIV